MCNIIRALLSKPTSKISIPVTVETPAFRTTPTFTSWREESDYCKQESAKFLRIYAEFHADDLDSPYLIMGIELSTRAYWLRANEIRGLIYVSS